MGPYYPRDIGFGSREHAWLIGIFTGENEDG